MDGLATPARDPAGPDLRPGAGCPVASARGGRPSGAAARSAWTPLAGTPFLKMSGGGNDFLVFDNRARSFPKGDPALVAALCARGTGVGADAVLLLEPPEGDADFRMVYYNADGSEAPMCGNGALCVARFAAGLGLAVAGSDVRFETGAGPYRAAVVNGPDGEPSSRVRLAMREPRGVAPSVPAVEARGWRHAGLADTGTPHLVVQVDDLQGLDVAVAGRELRQLPEFAPDGLNVNFVRVLGPAELALRTYERGVEAETLSCGTGATAAAILTHLWGLTAPPMRVHPPGGFELRVDFRREPGAFRDVTLEGDARVIYEGRLAAD